MTRKFVKHKGTEYPEALVARREGSAQDAPGFPESTIIIPTRDGVGRGLLPKLLQDLKDQTYQNFELILVQGDPRQGRAINRAVDESHGKWLIIMDDDIRLGSPRLLERLTECLQNPRIGMAGVPNLVPAEGPWLVRKVMEQVPRKSSPMVSALRDSDLAEHPCCAIPKEVFVKVGGEHELMPRGLDPYLRREIRNAGYRVVVIPEVWIHHLPPETMLGCIRQWYRNGYQAAYCQKYFPEDIVELTRAHDEAPEATPAMIRRVFRDLRNLTVTFVMGQWFHSLFLLCYGMGYAAFCLSSKNKNTLKNKEI